VPFKLEWSTNKLTKTVWIIKGTTDNLGCKKNSKFKVSKIPMGTDVLNRKHFSECQ